MTKSVHLMARSKPHYSDRARCGRDLVLLDYTTDPRHVTCWRCRWVQWWAEPFTMSRVRLLVFAVSTLVVHDVLEAVRSFVQRWVVR